MQPSDSSEFLPLYQSIDLFFSEAMQPEPIARSIVVADTLGDTIDVEVKWPDLTRFTLRPQEPYKPETFYYITLPVDSIRDLAGNPLADTLFQRQFTSVNPDTFSAIAGTVSDQDTSATGAIFMQAVLAQENVERRYELWLESEGKFEFEDMLPGRYTLNLYRDQDGNRRYSYGEAFPFEPAERYYVFPDTIEIRSRWPDDGENIILPR